MSFVRLSAVYTFWSILVCLHLRERSCLESELLTLEDASEPSASRHVVVSPPRVEHEVQLRRRLRSPTKIPSSHSVLSTTSSRIDPTANATPLAPSALWLATLTQDPAPGKSSKTVRNQRQEHLRITPRSVPVPISYCSCLYHCSRYMAGISRVIWLATAPPRRFHHIQQGARRVYVSVASMGSNGEMGSRPTDRPTLYFSIHMGKLCLHPSAPRRKSRPDLTRRASR